MITQSVLEKVAKLARIGLSPDELVSMTADIEKIVGYFTEIRKLKLDQVSPMTHAVQIVLLPRPDQIHSTKCTAEQMPFQKHNHFYVPRVLE